MKSSGWSSLLLGTVLATTAFASAHGQTATPAAADVVAATRDARAVSTSDLTVDPAALLAASAIETARRGDRIAEEEIDRTMTGSIVPIGPGPRTGGLVEIRAPETEVLSAPKPAPEPVAPTASEGRPAPTAPTTEKRSEAAPADTDAPVVAEAPMPEAPAPVVAETPKPEAPAPVVAETPKPEAPAPVVAEAPKPEAPAPVVAEAPKPEAPAPVVAETAKPEAPAPVVAEAPKPEAPAPVVAEAPKPAPAPAVTAPLTVATTAPDEPLVPAQASIVPAARTTPVAAPATTATTAPTAPTAPAAEAVKPTPAAPVAAPTRSTDSAIAATLAVEQAAAALRTALEDLQPLAGSTEDRADRAALLAFYADRAYLPLFVDARGTSDRARAAMTALAHADEDGLEPRDYALPRIEAGVTVETRARAEIVYAQTMVRYARHLQTGRFDPARVHELVTPTLVKTETREVLDRIAGAPSVVAALHAYAPPHEGYRRLKAMLAELRATAPEAPMVMVPIGPTLKPGQKDGRVALLRERLGVSGIASDAEVFDPSLAEAVKAFQRDRGLNPTGTVGRDTVSALNDEKTGSAARIADLVANMERWRWLPRELGDLHVFVNVPDFHLDVMKDGRSIHHARVVVGKPTNPTPVFSDTMEQVVVNPYWNVPYSIVKKEMIGRLQSSAGQSLSRGGYEVRVGKQMVDPTTVDWATVNAANVSIRQVPGGGNALGNIKFLFPNQHAVYIHDTSSRGLFAQSFRALSHGCVRVHEPFAFADAVLSEEPDPIDGTRLKKMIGGGEKTLLLKRTVPVHIAYFTTWVDDAGQVQNRPDVYGHDARVKRLLGL